MDDPLRSKLPPGRHGLPPEFVRDNQRTRLLEGAAAAIVAEGSAITIASITKAASVSRRTFYEHFDNRDQIVAAMVSEGVEQLAAAMTAPSGPDSPPEEAIEAAIGALVKFIDEHGDLARAMIVGGPVVAPDAYSDGIERLAGLLPYAEPQHGRRSFVAGGIAAGLRRALEDGREIDRDGMVAFASGPLI